MTCNVRNGVTYSRN